MSDLSSLLSGARRSMSLLTLLIISLPSCDDDAAVSPPAGGPGLMTPSEDQGIVTAGEPNGGGEGGVMTPPAYQDQGPSPVDMLPPAGGEGAGAEAGLMAGSTPPLGGEPTPDLSCDPRLRAQACEAGSSCWQVPGGQPYQGDCVAGDDCDPLTQTGCPPEAPLCQLDGRSTRCVSPPEPPLMEGSPCLTEDNRALPCGEGLVCNLSVCVPACDPASAQESCGEQRGCVDITERVGRSVGYCGFLGSCDPFTGAGCSAQESCRFAMRPDDRQIVTYCEAEGLAQEGTPCLESETGPQGCASGLMCIGAGNGSATCRRICDTGAYVAPCPESLACREILSLGPNLPIRGVGLCVTNP